MDIKDINRGVVEQFRAGGEIEGMHRERLLLLTTKGARTGDERARLWAEITAANPFFVDHEKKANRQIPVVALTRA